MYSNNTTTPTTPIDVNKVVDVYTGKEGCRCGCRGKYTYASKFQEYGTLTRGYEVSDDEVNDKRIARVVRIMNERLSEVECLDGYIFDLKYSDLTVYTVYYQDPKRVVTPVASRFQNEEELDECDREALNEFEVIEL